MTTIDLPRIARRVALDVAYDGGSTRSIVAGVQPPTTGYAVSLAGYERTYPLTPGYTRTSHVQRLAHAYTDAHRAVLAQPGHYLRAWLDGNVLYLDVSQVVPERAVALRLGRERGQLAVFDLARREDVKVTAEEQAA